MNIEQLWFKEIHADLLYLFKTQGKSPYNSQYIPRNDRFENLLVYQHECCDERLPPTTQYGAPLASPDTHSLPPPAQ